MHGSSGRALVAAAVGLTLAALALPVRGQHVPVSDRSVSVGGGAAAALTFVVRNLRSDRGQVMGSLYDRPERWVREGDAVATCRVAIRAHEARCTFQNVRPGRYAFAFAHDEDGDGRFDRDVLGLPNEGYGFSNDVRPQMSVPSFQSASFQLGAHPVQRVVTTRYGI